MLAYTYRKQGEFALQNKPEQDSAMPATASLAHYKHTTLRLHALAERSTFTDT